VNPKANDAIKRNTTNNSFAPKDFPVQIHTHTLSLDVQKAHIILEKKI